MRTLLYALFVSIITSSFFCTIGCSAEPDEKLHLQCLYPTIYINYEGKKSHGTGFIVRSTKVGENEYLNVFLTAAHVANSNEPYTIKVFEYEDWSALKNERTYPAIFYAKDFNRDLAIGIFFSVVKMPEVKINMRPKLYISSDVFHVGCGVGEDPRLDYGKITSLKYKSENDKHWMLRTSAHTIPGDSGGPLFSKYQVIGICRYIRSWRGVPVFNMSYYVPISCLQDWSNEENGAYDFVWQDRAIPVMASWELRFGHKYRTIALP